jgi:outer membrane protein insertion porin family
MMDLRKKNKHHVFGMVFLLACIAAGPLHAQETDTLNFNIPTMDYSYPREYEVAGITISGVKILDASILVQLTGIKVGERIVIPGDRVTKSIEKLWAQGLFSDIKVTYTRLEGGKIYLDYFLQERPRLSRFTFEGTKRSETQDLLEKINLLNGSQVTENILNNVERIVRDYYVDKGFLNVDIQILQEDDPSMPNNVRITVVVDKNDRVKVSEIHFEGNSEFSDDRLKRVMKNTKKKNWNIFKASKYIEQDYKEDLASLEEFYNKSGYRDFQILGDSISRVSEDRIDLFLEVYEGTKYYVRDISWVGNTKFPSELLSAVLDIKKGDPYNRTKLDERLFIDEDAVNSVYMDQGYLFSSITPVEVQIEDDSIDLEMRVFEGPPATIDRVIITGNTKTNEHVVRRELRTNPGDLFSKSAIMRSAREIAVLGHFDPESIAPNPIPHPEEGTVDIEYQLTERANDQFEISGGWGAGMLVGTIGLRFNNFSIRRVLDWKAWRPVPSGDGQTLSLRAQSNGKYYQSYNLTFVEPWFGGKKPNALSFSAYRSIQTNGRKKTDPSRQAMYVNGVTLGLGKRLKWPDDFFHWYNAINYQNFDLQNWNRYFLFSNGTSHNLSLTTTLSRNSAGPNQIYPTQGANVSLSLQITPPYSLFSNKDFSDPDMLDSEKYKFVEYHKWGFQVDWYLTLAGKLVLYTRAHFGYLGYFNKDIGPSPFGGFDVGGDGMSGYSLYGRDVIALRGYENGSLTPVVNGKNAGNVYQRVSMELRYPISLKQQATVFALVFIEGGNAWARIQDYSPYGIHRSAGVGLRAFLPMFGLLGIDWGYGFNPVPGRPDANGSQFHFVIGQQF